MLFPSPDAQNNNLSFRGESQHKPYCSIACHVRISPKLPTELIENVVLSLSLPDIVKWRQLSHFSKEFIDNTSAIQYRIAALAHDIQSFDAMIAPMVDKLKGLHLYLIAQNTLQVNSALPPSVPFAAPGKKLTWKILKNGLVMATDGSTSVTTISQFPSLSRGIPFREWNFDSSDSPTISIDPSQDLLVLVFKTAESLRIRITSLSSGGKHPLSNITEKDLFIQDLESSDVEPRILGDEILIESRVDEEEWEAEFSHIVMSWKTGRIRTQFTIEQAISCVLLDTDYFLFLSHHRPEDGRSLKLSVVDMASDPPSRVHFLLPDFIHSSDCDDYYITAGLETGSKFPLVLRPGSFPGALGSQSEIHDNLVALGISFDYGPISDECLVLISSFRLFQQIAGLQDALLTQNDVVVPWSHWGASCTAFFPGHVRRTLKSNGRYSVEGTRYIGWHSDDDVDKVVMYDFNRFGVEHDQGPQSEWIQDRLSKCPMFHQPLIPTTLGCRRFDTALELPEISGVGMANDYIFTLGVRL